MPRPPTKRHPVRDLRQIIQSSQKDFAEKIGVAPGTLKRIENKRLKLSRRVALLVGAETGANLERLLKGQLCDELGRQYTADFYAKWKTRYLRASEGAAKERASALGWWLEILLRAASKRNRLWQVVSLLNSTVDDCRNNFGLVHHVDGILRDIEPRVKWNPAGRTAPEMKAIQDELDAALKEEANQPRRKVTWHLPKPQSKQSSPKRRSRRKA